MSPYMALAPVHASSVKEFLNTVLSEDEPSGTHINLYRGQLNDFPLLPKLFRDPNTTLLVQKHERDMLKHLKNLPPHLRPSEPKNDWDWLSLGQHYGMSTRMSDWSANPLIALFFAVEINPSPKWSPTVYEYPIPTGYIEGKKQDDPLALAHTRVFQPIIHSHRSGIQAAWHIVHCLHELKTGACRFIRLTDMPPHNKLVRRISIDVDCVSRIRLELEQMGFTPSTVYGDLQLACRAIAPIFGLR